MRLYGSCTGHFREVHSFVSKRLHYFTFSPVIYKDAISPDQWQHLLFCHFDYSCSIWKAVSHCDLSICFLEFTENMTTLYKQQSLLCKFIGLVILSRTVINIIGRVEGPKERQRDEKLAENHWSWIQTLGHSLYCYLVFTAWHFST